MKVFVNSIYLDGVHDEERETSYSLLIDELLDKTTPFHYQRISIFPQMVRYKDMVTRLPENSRWCDAANALTIMMRKEKLEAL
jgi:hypothetical protein